MDKFQNKYRIPSSRLPNFNYGSAASYFVTICIKEHACLFGEIVNSEMILNKLGNKVELEWKNIPELRPDMNIQLGEFVVMPNHFHGILIIGENEFNKNSKEDFSTFGPQRKNLASILRGFKSSVTSYAKANGIAFAWQERFYDHIIRNNDDYKNIASYIYNNPVNWGKDKFYRPQ